MEFWSGVLTGVIFAILVSAIIGMWLAETVFETGDLEGEE